MALLPFSCDEIKTKQPSRLERQEPTVIQITAAGDISSWKERPSLNLQATAQYQSRNNRGAKQPSEDRVPKSYSDKQTKNVFIIANFLEAET
jgi:hypothetical protein